MNAMWFKDAFRATGKFIGKHSPEILKGFGITGMIASTILAVKATPKAMAAVQQFREENYTEEPDNKTIVIDTVKVAWRYYIPSAALTTVSTACIIAADSVHLRRNAALATAYKLSETAVTEYQDKLAKIVGEEKARKIKEEIAADKVSDKPVSKSEVIMTGNGKSLCFDAISSRYFESDIECVKQAVNKLNYRLIQEHWITLNEMYDELGLRGTSIGDDLGWDVDKGLIDITFGTGISDDGRPCLVLNYSVPPKYSMY